jgi:hypothetical protein
MEGRLRTSEGEVTIGEEAKGTPTSVRQIGTDKGDLA